MFRFQKNDKYRSIAIYAFCILAALILTAAFIFNFSAVKTQVDHLLAALQPLIYGLVIAYICNPPVRFFERFIHGKRRHKNRRSARFLALALTYLCIILTITLLALMILPQISESFFDLYDNIGIYLNRAWTNIDTWLKEADLGFAESGLSGVLALEDVQAAFGEILNALMKQAGILSTNLVTFAVNLLLGIVISAYILFNKDAVLAAARKMMTALLPRKVYRNVLETARYADRAFGRFIVGNIFDSMIVALLSFAVFGAVNIPYYPLVSAILGITNIIPAFGPLIGTVPSAIIIFIKDPSMLVWFLVLELILQQINGNLISPRVVGSATGVAPVWVITAIILAGAYFGPIGWFIGVPLFAILYRVIGNIANSRLKKKNYAIDLSHFERPLAVILPEEPVQDKPAATDAARDATASASKEEPV